MEFWAKEYGEAWFYLGCDIYPANVSLTIFLGYI
jgi:hypothetical protein